MTMPEEIVWSLNKTRDFLIQLMRTKAIGGYNGVPPEVRKVARSCLRHFPFPHDLKVYDDKRDGGIVSIFDHPRTKVPDSELPE